VALKGIRENKVNIRLTPLNILTSCLLVSIAYLIIYPDREGWRLLGSISLLVIAVISGIADLLFRRWIKDLKRIWIIEIVFIIFAAISIVIIQKI
jgi:hypothetical protein